MMWSLIRIVMIVLAVASVRAADMDVTAESRFAAFGFDDGRESDFTWVAPLFTKYGAHATFNVVNTPHKTKPEYVAKVNELIAQGHEIGDHTIFHVSYMYAHPFFNGQPEANFIGGKGFPSNDDMRGDHGDGRNVFNTPLDQKLKDSKVYGMEKMGLSAPETLTWRTLSDEDCQKIRNYYSVWNGMPWNSNLLDYLDKLSAMYCGTHGSSKDADAWNGTAFTKGIFTGCKTTANHEIWDRLVEIQRQWYTRHFNLKEPPTNWSLPGGPQCDNLLFWKDGRRHFDRECAILANHYGKCVSTRTRQARSWADLLRGNGIKTVSDSIHEGRIDGAPQRSILVEMPFNANLSKDDNVCRLEFSDALRFGVGKEYDPAREPLANSQDWLKAIYENDSTFKLSINRMVRNCASGRIAFAIDDSEDTFTWRMIYDLVLQFCQKAGIKAVSMREAYEIAYHRPLTQGNLFRNPHMRRTVFEVIGAKNAPEPPDGWTAGKVEEPAPPREGIKKMLVLDTTAKTEYFLFGVPPGTLDFAVMAIKGTDSSKLTIKKVRNCDPYLNASACPTLAAINIDNDSAWKEYRATLFLEDAPRLVAPSAASPGCDGLDNKICGLVFVFEGRKTKVALPSLTIAAP